MDRRLRLACGLGSILSAPPRPRDDEAFEIPQLRTSERLLSSPSSQLLGHVSVKPNAQEYDHSYFSSQIKNVSQKTWQKLV
jgi:hypothetical protein